MSNSISISVWSRYGQTEWVCLIDASDSVYRSLSYLLGDVCVNDYKSRGIFALDRHAAVVVGGRRSVGGRSSDPCS